MQPYLRVLLMKILGGMMRLHPIGGNICPRSGSLMAAEMIIFGRWEISDRAVPVPKYILISAPMKRGQNWMG